MKPRLGAERKATRAVKSRLAAKMWAVSLLLLAGCGPLPPRIVHNVDALGTTFEVCYNRLTATPEAVTRLAKIACDKKGAQAQFVDSRILRCSLLLPVSAIFKCR